MTIDGIVEGISAKIMTDSARIMINSARIMINSASSAFTLRFLEHTPPPATQRARVTEETFTEATNTLRRPLPFYRVRRYTYDASYKL